MVCLLILGLLLFIMLSNDNKFLIAAAGKSVKVFTSKDLEQVYNFENAHNSKIHSFDYSEIFSLDLITGLAITSDDSILVSASTDLSVKLFDFTTKQEIHHFVDVHQGIYTIS